MDANELQLIGDLEVFRTHASIALGRNVLKRVSSEARFSDAENQFSVELESGFWNLKTNPNAQNLTTLNGSVLPSDESVALANGDVIALVGRRSGKTAMPLSVCCHVEPFVCKPFDLVVLLDSSSSMQPVWGEVKRTLLRFLTRLLSFRPDGRRVDARVSVMGYRNREADGAKWLERNPFVRSVGEIQAQFSALEACGGASTGSLLDALAVLCEPGADWEDAELWPCGDPSLPSFLLKANTEPDPWKWRPCCQVSRLTLIITDKPCEWRANGKVLDDRARQELLVFVSKKNLAAMLIAPVNDVVDNLCALDRWSYISIGSVSDVLSKVSEENLFREIEYLNRTVS